VLRTPKGYVYPRLRTAVLRSLQADFHIYSAFLERFCYTYSAIVDSFVIVSFFLENIILSSIIVD